MAIPTSLRKQLGKWKCRVIDTWPYLPAMKSIPRHRAALAPQLDDLPPLPDAGVCEYEIHMLCGHRDIDMGIWASWSVLRFLEGKGRLIVHSDGSLTEEDARRWGEVVPRLVVADREDSDRKVRDALEKETPLLYGWRCSNWASAQLVDVHFYGDAPTLLIMDSDVLGFARPDEVMAALTAAEPGFRWCRDLRNAYSADPGVIVDITGLKLPDRLCAGFLVAPRMGMEDFRKLEAELEKIEADPRVDLGHFWSCQTYYGLMAARYANSKPLPSEYDNTDTRTRDDAILRHFVGIPKVRFRYFTEGLPRVAADARNDRPAPPLRSAG